MFDKIRVPHIGTTLLLAVVGAALAAEPRELTWNDLIPDVSSSVPSDASAPPPDDDLVIDDNWDDDDWDDQSMDDEDWEDDAYSDLFAPPAYPEGVVEELDGVRVKLPGFIVPLELSGEGEVREFLLVPYFGACIHYPPPPSNQLVYVTLDSPVDIESTWEPIWATGELKTQFHNSDLGAAGYTMLAEEIDKYEY